MKIIDKIEAPKFALGQQYNDLVHFNARQLALRMEGIKPAGSQLAHNEVALANDSQFAESYFSQPLTGYAVVCRDPNDIKATLGFAAPDAPVPRAFTYAVATNAEEFIADSQADLVRALNADFKQVKAYTESKVKAQTDNKGLTMLIDLDRVAEKKNWKEQAVGRLLNRCYRSELRESVTLLSAAAVNTNRTWDGASDPDMNLISSLNAGATASGIRPTRILFGENAFTKRLTAYRSQNNAGGYASSAMSQEQMKAFYMVDDLYVSRERIQAGATKAEIVNNLVLSFFAQNGMSEEDPSNIKRFTSPCEGGTYWRIYEQQISAKIFLITVEFYSLIKITSTLGVRKETIS